MSLCTDQTERCPLESLGAVFLVLVLLLLEFVSPYSKKSNMRILGNLAVRVRVRVGP